MKPNIDGFETFFLPATERQLRRQINGLARAAGLVVTVNFRACDDDEIQGLNLAFRGKNVPTDVLSFPADDDAFALFGEETLGDIAISVDTAQRQADLFGHSVVEEMVVLAAHGIAHLVGFDHERSHEEARAQAEFELMMLDAVGADIRLALCGRVLFDDDAS